MESSPSSHLAYSISEREEEGDFFFITDDGAEYSVYFTDGEGYAEGAAFAKNLKMFGFQRLKRATRKPRIGHDNRIMPTITEVLYRFLSAFPESVVIYACSDKGGSQEKRNDIFADWFRIWEEVGIISIEKVDYSLYKQIYCSCLFRTGHPCEVEVKRTIEQTVLSKQ